jgi:sigma-B regulation protein RsbU (phosphoserine phosphatase)
MLAVLASSAGLICVLNARNAERSAQHLAEDLQMHTTRVVEGFLSSELRGPQQAIQAMADAVSSGLVDPRNERQTALYLSRLAHVFPNAPFLNYGLRDGTFIGVGQAGNSRDQQMVLVVTKPEAVLRTAQYKLRRDGGRGAFDYEEDISDFRQAPWYRQPLEADRPSWTEIYNWDDQPEVMALGAGMPLLREGRVIGVAGVDMILANISAYLRQVAGHSGAVIYITDRQGLLVASSTGHRPFDLVGRQARRRAASQDPDPWIRAGAGATAGYQQSVRDPHHAVNLAVKQGNQRGLLRLTPWQDNRGLEWQIAMVMPESIYADIVGQQTRQTLAITGLALLGAAAVGWRVVRLICHPLERVTGAAEGLAAEEQPQRLPASPIAEIERLSRSFDSMATQMKESLDHLQARHAAVEREIEERSVELSLANAKLQEELNRAAAIQAEMLMEPGRFTTLSPDLEAAVRLVPSKEVAGDLYDAIPMGSDRICFCIGDVSGKGMPAALLMSTCLSLLRTYVELVDRPGEIMQRINRHLCEGNDDCTFTTLLIGIYHTRSGELRYCNAGHNPCLLRRHDGAEVEVMDQIHGPALGVSTEIMYGEGLQRLALGDTLLAYTDGANETFNRSRQRYGLPRMRAYLAAAADLEVRQFLDGLLADLDRFADGEMHHDDTTLLALRRCRAPESSVTHQGELNLTVRNQLPGVADALEGVKAFGQEQQLSRGKLRNLLVVIDELLNNIVSHGCRHLGDRAEIGLQLLRSDERLVIILHDNGLAFNPVERRSPDVASESEERPIGGLGIHLMRGLTTATRYRYEDGVNWITLEMSLA